ncbi:uncharacterized protein LOC120014142 [Tripterygium wilfordii]|uniref:uncharacterized protein LOC120014142 n=1 Tax=Tripterygium wilfordii TaxID=458696 RepID=UPI0018F82CA9|nr:uncharacterized protein LOC120014142 [Tripterygium wilfordii]
MDFMLCLYSQALLVTEITSSSSSSFTCNRNRSSSGTFDLEREIDLLVPLESDLEASAAHEENSLIRSLETTPHQATTTTIFSRLKHAIPTYWLAGLATKGGRFDIGLASSSLANSFTQVEFFSCGSCWLRFFSGELCAREFVISREMENDPNLTDESADDDTSEFEDGSEEDGPNLFMDKNESEYADSDYLVTPENSSDEAPKKPKFPQFNANVDLQGDITLVIGQIFADHVLFRKALKEFSIQHGFDYIFMKNDKWRVTAICARHYGWRIHASPTQDKATFQIKSFNAVHNCGKHDFSSRVDAKWLAHKYLDHLRDAPDWDVVAFKKQVHRDHNIDVSKGQCYRAKRIAYNILQGTHVEQYRQLWDYCAAVLKCNSGSTLAVSCPNSIFENFYVCLEACKKGFKAGYRPLICLDGCHLKTKYGGHILAAVGKDANDNMYPIAYVVVQSECRASWTWFLTLLQDDIGNAHDNGLIETFEHEFPGVHHRFCVRHLYANFKKRWNLKTLKDYFFVAAGATTQRRFSYWMEEIKKIDIQAFHWINQHDPILWSKHAFNPNVKCDIIVNNIAKTFNN